MSDQRWSSCCTLSHGKHKFIQSNELFITPLSITSVWKRPAAHIKRGGGSYLVETHSDPNFFFFFSFFLFKFVFGDFFSPAGIVSFPAFPFFLSPCSTAEFDDGGSGSRFWIRFRRNRNSFGLFCPFPLLRFGFDFLFSVRLRFFKFMFLFSVFGFGFFMLQWVLGARFSVSVAFFLRKSRYQGIKNASCWAFDKFVRCDVLVQAVCDTSCACDALFEYALNLVKAVLIVQRLPWVPLKSKVETSVS